MGVVLLVAMTTHMVVRFIPAYWTGRWSDGTTRQRLTCKNVHVHVHVVTLFNCFMYDTCTAHVQHMYDTCTAHVLINLFIFSPKGENVDVKTLAPANGGGGENSKRRDWIVFV